MDEQDPQDSLRERLERHLPALHAFLRLQAGARIAAKESTTDLAQSVCHEVLRDLEAIEDQGDAAFRNLLYHRALQKIADRARYWDRDKRAPDREVRMSRLSDRDAEELIDCYGTFCSPSRNAITHEEIGRIESAFERLPEQWREVVILTRIAGFTLADTAARLDRTEGQVRGLLARGLARLAEHLKRG